MVFYLQLWPLSFIVSPLLCCLISSLYSLSFHSESGGTLVQFQSGSQDITSKFWSSSLTFNTPSTHPPPLALSTQTDMYLFPRRELLTASQPGNSPTAHSCKTRWYSPLTGGKLQSHYRSQLSVSTRQFSRGPSSIKEGSSDTIATQSTAWQLDRLSQATSHILSRSISDKPAQTGHQRRR